MHNLLFTSSDSSRSNQEDAPPAAVRVATVSVNQVTIPPNIVPPTIGSEAVRTDARKLLW